MGRLSTHVLDTVNGCPAEGVNVALYKIEGSGAPSLIASMRTNAEGRLSEPLIADGALESATYEIVFSIGDYFRKKGTTHDQPAFLEKVPVRFQIADPGLHYHIPLVCSPWSYSTYRGS